MANCEKCKYRIECENYEPKSMIACEHYVAYDTKSEHLFSVLKEALRHPAIDVKLKEDGTINLFFDGCCECDIQIKNYTDLRGENLYDNYKRT